MLKSNLSKAEFKKRLTELTSEEKSFYFFTPYNSSGTPFCGTYDDNTFDLTRNSYWRRVKYFTIKGEYKESDGNTTEIEYKIGQTKFSRILFVVVNCLAIIMFNAISILGNSNRQLWSVILAVNGFIVFGNLWIFTVNWITKKFIEQRFKDEFEIGVEDEWGKLARSIKKS